MRLTVLVCPGFTSQPVVMTTGVGKLFTALSVRLAMDCTAPDVTVTDSCDVLVATRAMTRAAETLPACARASRAPSVMMALETRRLRQGRTQRPTQRCIGDY